MVIQAGPPFLVVHCNAAYTRLTGIDAHAAVGKPVSVFMSIQGEAPSEFNALDLPETFVEAGEAGVSGGPQDLTRENMSQTARNEGSREVSNQGTSNARHSTTDDEGLSQSHAAAAEAGRARAAQAPQNDSNMCLERLVAASGWGKFHVLNVTSRPQHLLGRNVTFVNAAPTGGSTAAGLRHGLRKRCDGSSDTSITSNFDGPLEYVACRISISPIVSDAIDSAIVTDTNQDPHSHKSKRRKHHHNSNEQLSGAAASWLLGSQHRRTFSSKDSTLPKRYQQFVTHYVIQLEPLDSEKDLNGKESLSSRSTSVEANLLGLTKSELRRQREAAQGGTTGTSHGETEQPPEDEEEIASETTEATVPVNAIG